MDKISSVIAALDAGKLPSQQQLNAFVDWLLVDIIPSEATHLDFLTPQGRTIARDLVDTLVAYRHLGANKNHDNLVQNTLWHLSEGDLSSVRIEPVDVKEASTDMNAIRTALRNLIKIFWANISGEGVHLLGDFISFVRLALADLVEAFETQAAHTKESLRETESEVKQEERDPLGRKRETDQDETDPSVNFEKTMDTVKETDSQVIGVGKSVKGSVEDEASRTRTRLTEAFYQVCDQAQSDQEYRRSLSTLFSIASKWLNRTLDTPATADEATCLSTFIDDPTEEKHAHRALNNIRILCERLAGGKSVDDIWSQLRACSLDIKQDKDLQAWFCDFIAHVHKGLETPGYARSQEAQAKRDELERRWRELIDKNSNVAKQWKANFQGFRRELHEFQLAIANDVHLRRAREARTRLVLDIEESVVAGGRLGLQYVMEQASWFWQDLFNVYTQRILNLLKSFPIPRIEYVDRDIEFVLENLDISSFDLLPGHAYLRNITDIEITAPCEARGSTRTAFGTLTHIHLQAIRLALRDISFFYKDSTSTVGTNIFTGIMQFNLPTQGLDVDFKFRLIPNTEEGLAERDRNRRFFKVERVDVQLASDIKFDIKESNHPVLTSVFKPVLVHRFRDAIERTLEEHIRGVFDFVDAIAFDVSKRSEVFEDTGLDSGASLAAAIWSEIGHLRKTEGGLLIGWKATGTGIIREGPNGEPKIALGAEPQILSGEKRGPFGTASVPLAERTFEEAFVVSEGRGRVVERVREVTEEGRKRVQTFKESVQQKAVEEKKRAGWESDAFDV